MLEKIKKMKGFLWRKVSEKPEETKLPHFIPKPINTFVELPSAQDTTKIDVIYPLISEFASAHIKWDPKEKQLMYFLEEPGLSKEEEKILDEISSALIDLIEVKLTSVKKTSEAMKYLEEQIAKVMKEISVSLNPDQYIRIMYYIYRNFVGLNEIEPLLRDPWLEDIGCDGVNIPLYIVHRKYGSLKTNVVFDNVKGLREFIVKLSERCGRYVSYAEPILAGTLPDGSRVSATLAGDVATRGPTFSIRKFTERPFSPIEQISLGTISPGAMAYLWYLVESGVSLLIAGGVATGKTTFLNSISMFIAPEAKIVSIEDTRELRIPHEHWIPSVARLGFGIPMPTGEKYGQITLFDLLKGSFRQNPDYVIVGEVRGKEAYVMFQGMSSGHPCMSTFHAGSVDSVIKRLTTPPIELSSSLVESLDAIAIMTYAKKRGKSARRIKEVEEIISIDSETFEVETFKSVEWNPKDDTFVFNKNSFLLKKIARNKGIDLEEILKEIARRKAVLEWMTKRGKKDFTEVTGMINDYYKNPSKILQQVGSVTPIPEVKTVEKVPVKKEVREEKIKKIEEKEKVEKIKKIEKKEEKEKTDLSKISKILSLKIVSEK